MANPDLVVRVAANISALQADMLTAAQSINTVEKAAQEASLSSAAFASSLDAVSAAVVALDQAAAASTEVTAATQATTAALLDESAAFSAVAVSEVEADKALSAMTAAQNEAAAAATAASEATEAFTFAELGLIPVLGYGVDKVIQWVVKATDLDTIIEHMAQEWLGWGISAKEAHDLVDVTITESDKKAQEAEAKFQKMLKDRAAAQFAFVSGSKDFAKDEADFITAQLDRMIAKTKEEASVAQQTFDIASGLYDKRVQMQESVTQRTLKATNDRIIAAFQEQQAEQALLDEFNKSLEVIPQIGHAADDLGGTLDGLASITSGLSVQLSLTNQQLTEMYDNLSRGAGVGIGDTRSGSGAAPIITGSSGGRIPHFDSGGPVTRDGLIYAHAGEYVLPKEQASGGQVIQLVVDGRVLTEIVNNHNMRSVRSMTKVGSA